MRMADTLNICIFLFECLTTGYRLTRTCPFVILKLSEKSETKAEYSFCGVLTHAVKPKEFQELIDRWIDKRME